jgi:hypothetical protein
MRSVRVEAIIIKKHLSFICGTMICPARESSYSRVASIRIRRMKFTENPREEGMDK